MRIGIPHHSKPDKDKTAPRLAGRLQSGGTRAPSLMFSSQRMLPLQLSLPSPKVDCGRMQQQGVPMLSLSLDTGLLGTLRPPCRLRLERNPGFEPLSGASTRALCCYRGIHNR